MKPYSLTRLDLRPVFDAETFMRTAATGPLDATALAALEALWPRTSAALNAWRIDADDNGSRLLLWLDEGLEQSVERRFEDSPSQGFLEHALAVHCVMAAAATVIPELAGEGCAPVPAPHPAVRKAILELGLAWPEKDTLCRRYSLLTALPWAGSCETCTLANDCPRLKT